MVSFDPAATLRCWTIDVYVGGAVHTIPPLPAADWVLAVLGPLDDVVPGLFVDPTVLDDLILDGVLPPDELAAAARAVIGEASGTHWWTARGLAHAGASTGVGHELLARGLDLSRLPFGAYLAAVYRTGLSLLDADTRSRWEYELERPPPGVSPGEWFDPAEAEASYLALMGAGG